MAETVVEITADQVVRLFPRTTRPHAARVAAYIELRRTGAAPIDAAARIGLSTDGKSPERYERWCNAVLDALGLPPPAKKPVRTFTTDPFHYARRGQ